MSYLNFSKDPSGESVLSSEVTLTSPIAEVFSFFKEAQNLERLTPSFLSFSILSPLPIEMKKGALIDYRIKLYGVAMKWRTEITQWNPPYSFEDTQIKGPYLLWRHLHSFEETERGTIVRDRVNYKVFGPDLIDKFFVQKNLRHIFSYRQEKMRQIFS